MTVCSRLHQALLATFCATPAMAQPAETGGYTPLFDSGYLLQVVGSLLFVCATLFVVLWLLRAFSRGAGTRSGLLQVQASASLGGREKVVLLQAGDAHLLLGVSPGRVELLHRFEEPPLETPAAEGGFAVAMRQALGQRAGGKH